MNVRLMTDSASDLSIDYVRANNIEVASLEVNIKGDFVPDDLGQTLKLDYFYNLLREGEQTSTSQVNIHTFEEMFERAVQEGYAVIYIGLASILSGTVNSALIAKNSIEDKYPNADITVIDSKSASLGEGALVYYASELLKLGKTKTEVVQWIEEYRTRIIHAFTVDDLGFLKRGGRISSATSVVGTLLSIKPSLKLDNEGSVIPGAKIKGAKNALKYLAQQVKEKGTDLEDQVIFICHGDVADRAETLKTMILNEVSVKDVVIGSIGAVIGTHVGPGSMGVMFIGKER